MRVQLTLELYETACQIKKELERLYPNCFFPIGSEKPLKVGIMEDLLDIRETLDIDPIPTEEGLKASILIYTGCLSYRVNLIREGSMRIDLEGNAVGVVTDDERLFAKTKPLFPQWKLTPEELTIFREQREIANTLRRERNLANEENLKVSQQLNDQLKVAFEQNATPVNPNADKPKLSLKIPK
jgi:sRNA-binding protein